MEHCPQSFVPQITPQHVWVGTPGHYRVRIGSLSPYSTLSHRPCEVSQGYACTPPGRSDLNGGGLHIGPLAGNAEEHSGRGMVAEILPNPWQVVQHGDSDTLELCCRANARAQEQVWRADGATTQHNVVCRHCEALSAALDFNPNRPAALKEETTSHDVTLKIGRAHV